METADTLLTEATRKLIELQSNPEWSNQLPRRCPPVLWFGNEASQKSRILTMGANPSRQEFLSDSSAKAVEKLRESPDQSSLTYLEPPRNRFRALREDETLPDILKCQRLRAEIIASYRNYFCTDRHYKTWFGHDRDDSYWVEGFLRGFGASYFDTTTACFQAVHVDLFPFATLEDFAKLKEIVERDLFADGWAQEMVSRLVKWLAPECLILFGRANYKHFCEHFDETCNVRESRFQSGQCFVGCAERLGVPIVALSTNLGNPKGFDALELRQYGEYAQNALRERWPALKSDMQNPR